MSGSTLLARFSLKIRELNESYKLCQVRGKYTVGGIVFYKHLFLIFNVVLLWIFFFCFENYRIAGTGNVLGHCAHTPRRAGRNRNREKAVHDTCVASSFDLLQQLMVITVPEIIYVTMMTMQNII